MFLLGPFSFRFFFEFIKFFLFVVSINLVEIVSLFDFVFSKEEQDDSVILFDFRFDSKSVAIEAVHFEEFKQSIDDERIVSRQDEFNVARVAWTLQSDVAASLTYSMLIIGRNTHSWVIKTIFIGEFGRFVVDVGIVDFADTDFSNFVRVEETEFNFRDFIPLPLSMDGIGHGTILGLKRLKCWDYIIKIERLFIIFIDKFPFE